MRLYTLVIIALLSYCGSALGVTYTWTDDQGTMNFTEDRGSIPKKYRKQAKILGEEEQEQPAEPEVVTKKETVSPASAREEQKVQTSEAPDKMKTIYGGKEGGAWRADFRRVNNELKAAEDQLAQLQERLKDTSRMSRSEYQSIQATIKNVEDTVNKRRKRADALVVEADAAKVPADLR